jgi:hypothetical protein
MDDEAERRARLRDRIQREAPTARHAERAPGRTTLVEQLHSSRPLTTPTTPGKTTLVAQEGGGDEHAPDVERVMAQAREAIAGPGDREDAYEAVVNALASAAIAPALASELMQRYCASDMRRSNRQMSRLVGLRPRARSCPSSTRSRPASVDMTSRAFALR